MTSLLRRALPAGALLIGLVACAAWLPDPQANAATTSAWPAPWQDDADAHDFAPPHFAPPSATDCHRPPALHEVPGRPSQEPGGWVGPGAGSRPFETPPGWDERSEGAERSVPAAMKADTVRDRAAMAEAPMPAPVPSPAIVARTMTPPPATLQAQPAQSLHRPRETVTAGVVDDNADFGAYLAYRQRHPGLPVHDRDVNERYLLEVTDAAGRPVHDAEVALQRRGVAAPVMWARTDTGGRVWLHPRVFLAPDAAGDQVLGIAVRQGSRQARAVLVRGQAQAVQVQLDAMRSATRPRLDLVFLVDATGSMGDEIDKLKASMQAMAQQIAELPGQPDVCFGLVAYRDRGDAFLSRSYDFTDDLPALQRELAQVQAGGGGDIPEALNEALHQTVHNLSWRAAATRLVVLVADAPPHLDYTGCLPLRDAGEGDNAPPLRAGACPQYDRDMQAALAKGIKLFVVGASGLDPVGEYVFRQLAQYTGGRFVFLTYRNAADPGSGPGTQTVHDVQQYSVQTLDRLVVRLVREELARLAG